MGIIIVSLLIFVSSIIILKTKFREKETQYGNFYSFLNGIKVLSICLFMAISICALVIYPLANRSLYKTLTEEIPELQECIEDKTLTLEEYDRICKVNEAIESERALGKSFLKILHSERIANLETINLSGCVIYLEE